LWTDSDGPAVISLQVSARAAHLVPIKGRWQCLARQRLHASVHHAALSLSDISLPCPQPSAAPGLRYTCAGGALFLSLPPFLPPPIPFAPLPFFLPISSYPARPWATSVDESSPFPLLPFLSTAVKQGTGHARTHAHARTHDAQMHAHTMHKCTHTRTHARTHARACTHTRMHKCIHKHTCVHTHIHIHLPQWGEAIGFALEKHAQTSFVAHRDNGRIAIGA